MNHDPVLTGAALSFTQHRAGDPTTDPTTVSVRLTSRIFQTLHVQLAAAENLEATPGRHALVAQPIALRALTEPLEVRLDTFAPAVQTSRTEVDLELTIDDGDPAGPYTLTQRLGILPPPDTAKLGAEHTLRATFTPHCLTRPTNPKPEHPMDFHDLHHTDIPLLLPNAWDVASAVAFADAGFPAVATTSFGVGAAAGHADGARASREATTALVHALAALPAHVSADIEDGYADDPDEVAAYVADLATSGTNMAGINIEDSTDEVLIDPAAHAAKITAIKQRTPEVFVNARIDNYWLGQQACVKAVLRRAEVYAAAGADGIFVPAATDPTELRALTTAIPIPVNVLVIPDHTLEDLAGLGIRRVSTGSLPYRAALDAALGVATAVRDGTRPAAATPYPEAQQRLIRYAQRRRP